MDKRIAILATILALGCESPVGTTDGTGDPGPVDVRDGGGTAPRDGGGASERDASDPTPETDGGEIATDGAMPPPPPPPPGEIVGYGAGTVGGNDAEVVVVRSLAELRTEIARTGPKNVRLEGSGVWNLDGRDLAISRSHLTLDGCGADVVFRGGSIKITASEVILRCIKSRAGDESGNAQDIDAITVNGNAAPIDHIVLDRVEALWGPDVASAFLGAISDVTVQYSILGEGLFRSAHPEANDDADGHSLAANIASTDPENAPARLTFYATLITTSQSRQPRIIGGAAIDFIDCVFYNYHEGPQGNPQSLNLIGNTWKWGPASREAGLGDPTRLLWRYQPGGHGAFATRLDARVYIDDAQTIGFTAQDPSGDDARVLASSPVVAPSVESIGAAAAYERVLAEAGVRLPAADAVTQRLIDDVRNGTGRYVSATGYPAPNPSW